MRIGDGGHFPWSPFFSSRFVRFLRLVSCSQTFCGTIYILTPQENDVELINHNGVNVMIQNPF